MLVNIIVRLFGSLTVLVSMLIAALVVTVIMVFGSTTELFETIYPERLFFQIFGWFVAGAVIASGITWISLNKRKYDYPPDEDYEYDKMEAIYRVTSRNNKIRIVLTVIILVGGIVNLWVYDIPFSGTFYLIGIIICTIFELINQIVRITLK